MTIQDKDLLLVGVEKNQTRAVIARGKLFYNCEPNNVLFSGSVDLPEGNWQIVGLYPGLTEEQAKLCVCKPVLYLSALYTDYTGKAEFFYTALESFASRMEAMGAYIKNPMGEKPILKGSSDLEQQEHFRNTQSWLTAQSRTSGQWLVLMKK